MKPHRRKDTPPRRDSDQGGGSAPEQDPASGPEQIPGASPEQAPLEDPNQPVEPPVYDQGAVGYDPGQALVDPGASYPGTNQAPADPGQAYVDPPQQAPVDPPGYPTPQPPPIAEGAGVYDDIPAPAPAPGPAAAPAPRKQAVRRPAGRRPATGARRPSSRYKRPKPVSYGGGVSVMTVFLGLIALAMLAVVAMVMLPKDLSSVKGYPINPLTSTSDPENLLDQAQRVMIDRETAITFSEEDVNAYLNHRLQGEQGGVISSIVKFKGVYVDFTPDHAEVIIEREIFGMPLTMSSKIRTEKFRRQILYKSAGWSLGKIEFNSRNVKPVIEMFMRLRKTCMEEFTTMKQMADVRFEQDALVLDSSI